MDMERIGRNLLSHQLFTHPLPWTIEEDWTLEVIASDRVIIAKCRTQYEAEEIIEAAQSIKEKLNNTDVEKLLNPAD